MLTFPNAKINLGLNVINRRPDGYHNIETVFYPIPLQDALEVKTSSTSTDYSIHLRGNSIEGEPEDNLVIKALRLLRKDFPTIPPVDIHLYKHIPSGAGLGGGSSDAAAMIKMLNQLFALQLSTEQMEKYASILGADCAFFIENRPVLAKGIGNIFEEMDVSLKNHYLVLVKPDDFVSTKEAYANIQPKMPEISIKEAISRPLEEWKTLLVNDFEKTVFPTHPNIVAIKDKLYDLGAVYAAMSGSGSSVFGIFKEPVEYVDEKFAGLFCRQRELLI